MRRFTELSPEEYEQFELNHSMGSYTQSAKQYELLSTRGRNPILIGVKDDNTIVAAALITTEKTKFGSVFLFDRGPLIDFSDDSLVSYFVNSCVQFAKKHGVLYIEWVPNVSYQLTDNKGVTQKIVNEELIAKLEKYNFQHQPFSFGMSTNGSPTWEYQKKLTGIADNAELMKSYTKNVQYYLKKNQQFGIQLRQLKRSELSEFKKLTQKTADRLHYHDKSLAFYEDVYDVYGEDATFIFAELDFETYINSEQTKRDNLITKLVNIQHKIDKYPLQNKFKRQYQEFEDQKNHHDSRIAKATQQYEKAGKRKVVVAGALFIKQPQEITYLYSGTYEEYMDYYGPYQIQDTMIRSAMTENIPIYNFYGISGLFDGSDGVLGFKTAFNGYARQLIGSFILPVNPIKYKAYRLLKKLSGRA